MAKAVFYHIMTLEELVGQKLVLAIEGTEATAPEIELFQKTHAGGLILFERNFENPGQLRQLIADFNKSLGRRLLILVDHEGGRVIRFKQGVTQFPDAETVAREGGPEWARRQGEVEGQELRSLGIHVNLAPVLDVVTDIPNPAIGNRSYGKDPQVVAAFGKARIEGMQSKGLSASAKHYPGLGEAVLDPHKELPTVKKNWKALKQHDLIPFQRAFEAKVDCVMSTHVFYPEVDPGRMVTFSRKICRDLLRLELGYSGVLLTDDLKMGAVSKAASLRETAPLAAEAGHDLLLICSDPLAQAQAFEALVWAYKRKELKTSELEEGVERFQKLLSRT